MKKYLILLLLAPCFVKSQTIIKLGEPFISSGSFDRYNYKLNDFSPKDTIFIAHFIDQDFLLNNISHDEIIFSYGDYRELKKYVQVGLPHEARPSGIETNGETIFALFKTINGRERRLEITEDLLVKVIETK